MTDDDNWRHLRAADHGILCTSNRQQRIDAVPVCFSVVCGTVVTPVDRVKAKETTELGRLRNLDHDAAATLLCEHWDPGDWSRLWWVRGTSCGARIVTSAGNTARTASTRCARSTRSTVAPSSPLSSVWT